MCRFEEVPSFLPSRSSGSGARLGCICSPLPLRLEDTVAACLPAYDGCGIPGPEESAGSSQHSRLAQERMALERRIPTKLSALKDRLIAAFDKSLYLSSHSREIAWKNHSWTESMDAPKVPKTLFFNNDASPWWVADRKARSTVLLSQELGKAVPFSTAYLTFKKEKQTGLILTLMIPSKSTGF